MESLSAGDEHEDPATAKPTLDGSLVPRLLELMFRASLINEEDSHLDINDSGVTSDEDTRKWGTEETELGASDRRLFVKQLETHSVHQPKWISVMTSVATFKSGFHMHPCLASLWIYTSQLTATAALVHPQSRPLVPPAEVHRGFEFSNDRPAFYLPPAIASWRVSHFRYESVFSIASTSSYGHVINSGSNDPFDYGLPSLCERPSSSDMSSISMSMTVDDTFAFIRDQPRHRVDSDASSFYFRPSATAPGTRGRCRRESNMSLSS